jgi:hypothetical protein
MKLYSLIPILTSMLEYATRCSPFLNCLQGYSNYQRIVLALLNSLKAFTLRDFLTNFIGCQATWKERLALRIVHRGGG